MSTTAEKLRELADEMKDDLEEGIEPYLIIEAAVVQLRRIADGAE